MKNHGQILIGSSYIKEKRKTKQNILVLYVDQFTWLCRSQRLPKPSNFEENNCPDTQSLIPLSKNEEGP